MSFQDDVAFLAANREVITLTNDDGAVVAVVPDFQARIMTSAASPDADGNGWINRELISSGQVVPHINPFGGEDRFWMGPEGGQYSIFFKQGDPYDLAHWQTPPVIDTDAYDVIQQNERCVTLTKSARLVNTSGTPLEVSIYRRIKALDRVDAREELGVDVPPSVSFVGHESDNRLTNTGDAAWTKEGGLLSIWILGMFKHSSTTTVIMPIVAGPESELGPQVNDAYFGKVPDDRIRIEDGHVFFRGDGECRSKIGISPRRAMDVCGSYDPARGLLTIVKFSFEPGATDYVNSMWEHQEHPYGGDVSNSYNDGPPAPGEKPLGPFYELESSSPALALAPGAEGRHLHQTYHFRGSEAELAPIATHVLGVELDRLSGIWS